MAIEKTLTKLDRPNSYIGRSVTRPNAKRLLAGKGRYVTDMKLPRMLYAAFVRSPYAHAKILSVDTSAALEVEGVHLVATGEDLAKLCKPWVGTLDHFHNMKSTPQLPLATDKVVWAGQAVAAVVASSRAVAEDAAELVNVDYEELPVVADIDAAREEGADLINPELGTNVSFVLKLESGDVEAAFKDSPVVVEDTFRFGRHTAVTLGATRHHRGLQRRRTAAHRLSRDPDAVSVSGSLQPSLRHRRSRACAWSRRISAAPSA